MHTAIWVLADKTNWRAMLKGAGEVIDLKAKAVVAAPGIADRLDTIRDEHGDDAIEPLDEDVVAITYPVTEYPTKITSLNFDKKPVVEGPLLDIKGQYLILDTGVINIRKFAGYEIDLEYGS